MFGFAEFSLGAHKLLRIRELMPNPLDSLPPEIFCKFRAENNYFSIYSKFAPAMLPVVLEADGPERRDLKTFP